MADDTKFAVFCETDVVNPEAVFDYITDAHMYLDEEEARYTNFGCWYRPTDDTMLYIAFKNNDKWVKLEDRY